MQDPIFLLYPIFPVLLLHAKADVAPGKTEKALVLHHLKASRSSRSTNKPVA